MRQNPRTTLSSLTPNQSRFTNIPQTAEKEKPPTEDRHAMHEKTQIVLDALGRSNVPEFNEILSKGLKVMTIKQFIMILSHFIKPICGTVQLDGSNYIENIMNLMQAFDYPYANLSKSTLKTPTAPHCQNTIIFFLAWLAEFAELNENVSDVIEYSERDTFITGNFAKGFLEQTEAAFNLWNKEEDTEPMVVDLKRQYIEMKTDGASSIEKDVKRLEADVENLRKMSQPASLNDELNAKSKEAKSQRTTIEKSIARKNEQKKKTQVVKSALDKQKMIVRNLSKEIHQIQSQISHQKMNAETKAKHLRDLTELRTKVATEKERLQESREQVGEKELELSNLVQKKIKLVSELNSAIYNLACDMELLNLSNEQRFDPSRVEIKRTKINESKALNQELDKLTAGLNDVKSLLAEDKKRYDQQQKSFAADKSNLIKALGIASDQHSQQKDLFEDVKMKTEQVDKETGQFVHDNLESAKQNQFELQQLNEDIDKTRYTNSQLEDVIRQLREQREKFKVNAQAECKKLYDRKVQEHEELQQKLAAAKALIANFNKVRKPLPEHVQKVVDEIKKEYEYED